MPDVKPEVRQRVILKTLEAFDPASQDHIITVGLANGAELPIRVVRVTDLQMDLVNNTEVIFTRRLRDQFLEEVKAGTRTFRLLEITEEIRETVYRQSKGELRGLLKNLWALDEDRKPEVDAEKAETLDENNLKETVYRFMLTEVLLETETRAGAGLLPRSLLDLGETVAYDTLDPEKRMQRQQERLKAVMDERRRPLRALTLEEVRVRLAYASATEPAALAALQRRRCILLYGCAREVENRNAYLFDLSGVGIGNLAEACADPQKTYDAMVEKLKGDESTLQQMANQVSVDAGDMTPELQELLEMGGSSPFRTGSGAGDEGDGEGAGVGDDSPDGDSSADHVSGAEGEVLAGGEGFDPASDIPGVPQAAPLDHRRIS